MSLRILVCAVLALACVLPTWAQQTADLPPHPERLDFLLTDNRFPVDPPGQPGAARHIWPFGENSDADLYVREHAETLARLAEQGRIDPGLWALLRARLQIDANAPATATAYADRFEREWAAFTAHLDSLPAPSSVAEDLFRRVALEQFGRHGLEPLWRYYPPGPERDAAQARLWAKISPVDQANTARVRHLLTTRDWFDDSVDGEGAADDAWLIVQHSDADPGFQREMLQRLEPFVGARVRPQNYALLWDRVAVKDQRPQRYGSQVMCSGGAWRANGGVEEPASLDDRRAEMSLEPWSEYILYFADLDPACTRSIHPAEAD